jgi:PhnB protein
VDYQVELSLSARRDLREGGETVMPLAKTFWAERFGVLVDRFGIRWIINCEG